MDKITEITYYFFKNKPTTYTIYETDKIEGKEGYLGYSDYDSKSIVIERTLEQEKRIETLIHELMHVWLEENGYNQDKLFHVEKICDEVAYALPFINHSVKKYCIAKGFPYFWYI